MADAEPDDDDRAGPKPRGRDAASPLQVPLAGWIDVAARVRIELKRDKCTLLAAGVAFYALLSLVPSLVALVSIYGLVSDPDRVSQQVDSALGAAPPEVQNLVVNQLEAVSGSSDAGLSLGLVVSLGIAVWGASRVMNHLISAVNTAYDELEDRHVAHRRAMALGGLVGAVFFLVAAFWILAILPATLRAAGWDDAARLSVTILRWPVLAGGIYLGLCVLYRYAPDRTPAHWRWLSVGAVVAMLLWLLGSAGLSLYTSQLADLNETYGTLGAVVVVLLWLFISAYAVLLGAEVNAELEHQTEIDTTKGPPLPMGERGATVADSIGVPSHEVHVGTGH